MLLSKRKVIIILIVSVMSFVTYDAYFNYVDWRTADRGSANLAPLPSEASEAVVQVYAARTYNWRGYFAVHSWIAIKPENAKTYTTYQVIGFYLWQGKTSVVVQDDIPDRKWYGETPELLADIRGEKAQSAIVEIKKAVADYPYGHIYKVYPGPNSNTFISYILRRVPELKVALPTTAIGKDFLGYKTFVAESESKTGWQFSLYGILGITIGLVEGIEFNLLGLDFGFDFLRPAIKLPIWGRIGMSREVRK